MEALEKFRGEVREWLEASCPPSMRTPMVEEELAWGGRKAVWKNPDVKLWLDRMAGRGWTAPTWPREYGGAGLSAREARVLQEEMRRFGCRRPLSSIGTIMLGPVLLEFGTEEQKREHLPRIARGEIAWCQGYSEPGAGSDLAGLQTRAVREGDEYVVNGQKIWTSYADRSDMIFCLVRTDPAAEKHNGISFLLIDMDQPGVSTAPIRLISGKSQFCQTFFENARAPVRYRIGAENQGWTIAKRLLQHERASIAEIGAARLGPSERMEDFAKRYLGEADGRLADPVIRDRIARHQMDSRAFALTMRRAFEEARAGGDPGVASSTFKYVGTEQNKLRQEILVECAGTQALGWKGEEFSPDELSLAREWLRSKANSIEGGTSEIQLNVIAKRVLGLPD